MALMKRAQQSSYIIYEYHSAANREYGVDILMCKQRTRLIRHNITINLCQTNRYKSVVSEA